MKKVKKIVFIMDSYETLNIKTETSLLLMDELLKRGQQVYWLESSGLYLQQQIPMGLVSQVTSITPFEKYTQYDCSLNVFDALIVRLDPPFDEDYLNITLILDHLANSVVQLNPVKALRDLNEKILPMNWPENTPSTLVSNNLKLIGEFLQRHEKIVLKPLNDCSGRGVIKLSINDTDYKNRIAQALLGNSGKQQYLQAQEYLPGIVKGDKRVFLLNGEVIGAVNRLPQAGNFLANIHQGAHCEATEVTLAERSILEKLKPFIIEHDLFTVGVDFIDGFITEINITSPSAIRQINEVSNAEVHLLIVDALLEKLDNDKKTLTSSCCINTFLWSMAC